MPDVPPWLHQPPPVGPCSAAFHLFSVGRAILPAGRREALDNRQRNLPAGVPYVILQATLAGGGWFADRGGIHPLPPGTLFVAPVPSPTRYGSDGETLWERAWISVSGPVAMQLARQLAAHGGHVIAAGTVPGLIDGLLSLQADPPEDPVAASARAFALFAAIAQARDRAAAGLPLGVIAALACMHRRLHDPDLAVADLAAAAGLSRFHFSRRFAVAVGEPPLRHLARLRLTRAAEMLAEGGVGVVAVARACGYGGRSHFSAAYRAFHGVPPGGRR